MAVRSDEAENRLFRDFFGCGAHLVVILWKMMDALDLLPAEVEVVHLLWTLYWLKCYPMESPATAAVGRPGHKVDPKTFHKYVQPIVFVMSYLEPHVVRKSAQYVKHCFFMVSDAYLSLRLCLRTGLSEIPSMIVC